MFVIKYRNQGGKLITIVTGNIHDGKTTKVISLYERHKGDGFVSIKNMEGNKVLGFDYLQLSTRKTEPLATKEKITPVRDVLGPYYFNEEAMTYIESSFREMINNNVSPIYLDEVGQLELDNKGFHSIISWMVDNMSKTTKLYISVRKSFVEQIIDKYRFKNIEIIEVSYNRN